MVSLAHCRHERLLSQWSLQSLQSAVSWPDNTHNTSRQCKSHLQVTSVRGKIARSHKTWEWRDCLHLGRAPGSDWEWEVSTRVAARVYPAHLSAHTGTHWDIPALSGQHATSLSHTGGPAQCYNYLRQLSAQTEGVSKVLSKQVFCSLCCTVSNPPAIGLCHLCKHSNILNNKLAIFSPLMFPMTVDCPVVREAGRQETDWACPLVTCVSLSLSDSSL